MFSRVVVPIDGTKHSLRALKPARVLADQLGVGLNAVTVVFGDVDLPSCRDTVLGRAAEAGVIVDEVDIAQSSTTVEDGLTTIVRSPSVLVVIGSNGHSHTLGIQGSVTEDLIHREAGGLTIVVGPNVDVDRFELGGTVLGCIDPEVSAEEILDAVSRLAKSFDLRPWLASVLNPAEVPAALGGFERPPDVLETNQLHALAERVEVATGSETNYDVLHERDAANALARYADDCAASLLVVSTRERGRFSRLVFGSVAIDLIGEATAPVVAVHAAND